MFFVACLGLLKQIGVAIKHLANRNADLRTVFGMVIHKVCRPADLSPSTHLYMFAIMASGWKLDPPECDWTLQRYFNSCLLHSVFTIESCIARRGCHTTKIPLDCQK